MGNCNHRRYIPMLLELVRAGTVDPTKLVEQLEPLDSALEAYEAFDRREAGWLKVELAPTATTA
jgi:threonine dehydrogenase-like Zn-dependent dehydrogenase